MMNKGTNRMFWMLLLLFSSLSETLAGEAWGVIYREGRVSLTLPVSGVVSDVLVEKGQQVSQGQILLKLDSRYAEARLHAARARVSRYLPGRDEAKRELERALELYDRTVLSEVELQQAKIDYAEKNAALEEARAEEAEARLDLEYSVLKAPFDLVVLHTHVVSGQAVVNELQAVPLVDVARDKVVVLATLPPERHVDVKTGKQVSVTYAGKSVAGTIVATDFDMQSQKITMTVSISDQSDVKEYAGHPVKLTWP
jgi:multidrug efflux system membrane fusion protein